MIKSFRFMTIKNNEKAQLLISGRSRIAKTHFRIITYTRPILVLKSIPEVLYSYMNFVDLLDKLLCLQLVISIHSFLLMIL